MHHVEGQLHEGNENGGYVAHSAARHEGKPLLSEWRGLREAADVGLASGLRGRPGGRSGRSRPGNAYAALVGELKEKYKISVRKWRRQMSGVAYEMLYPDGRIRRWISVPRPCGPVSAAIFLHEVGHHAIGFKRYSPRCLEEYYVWQWAFREMAARNIPVTERVLRHYRRSMHRYVIAALRRGGYVPHELHGFLGRH